jgi:exonuclease VII large subunit
MKKKAVELAVGDVCITDEVITRVQHANGKVYVQLKHGDSRERSAVWGVKSTIFLKSSVSKGA